MTWREDGMTTNCCWRLEIDNGARSKVASYQTVASFPFDGVAPSDERFYNRRPQACRGWWLVRPEDHDHGDSTR